MSSYPNSWNGNKMFYRGKRKIVPTENSHREYQAYCEGKMNKDKIISYKEWCLRQRRKYGIF